MMESILTAVFMGTLLVIGRSYLRFCKKMSEDILSTFKFNRKTEPEGGDNWPGIQLEMGDLYNRDVITSADFEKIPKQKREDIKELCGQI